MNLHRVWMPAAIVAGLLAASPPTLAQSTFQVVPPRVVIKVTCHVVTTLTATGIIFFNGGNVPVAAGANIHWTIDALGMKGDYVLTQVLSVGKTIGGVALPAGMGTLLARSKTAAPCRASTGSQRSP